MYSALWHRLPGPNVLKAVEVLVMLGVIVIVLFAWVFPWATVHLPIDNVTVDSGSQSMSTPGPPAGGQTE
jgi:high-affinity Fe2+/Pb2+ permease